MAKLPPQPIGVAPGSSYWNDWYEKLRTFVEQITTSVDWSIITGKPTTLAGYGITDAQTKLNNSADLAAALGDETGTGVAVFNNAPNLINPVLGNATCTTLTASGLIQGLTLTLGGTVTTGSTILHTTNVTLTNHAGAAVGTLNNAPTAGNPTKWIRINDNGTIRYIPTWT